MIRLCVIVLFVINVISSESQDDVFTSPILKRNKTNNYLSFAGKKYYFGNVFKANYFRATQYCRQQAMQLVTISTQAEHDRLGRFADQIGSRYDHFWTAGTRLPDGELWVWLSTGNKIIYTNWDRGQPSLKNDYEEPEECVELRDEGKGMGFTWNDAPCTAAYYFICETLDVCS